MNPISILPVIVLYKTRLQDSSTYRSLKKIFKVNGDSIQIFVYDNSREPDQGIPDDVLKVQYFHNAQNPGLSQAYNNAYHYASLLNKDWLLLLDQDTSLTDEYLTEVVTQAAKNKDDQVVAIIPQIFSINSGDSISPSSVNILGYHKPMKVLRHGIQKSRITAINSGTLIKTLFLDEINGFSTGFPLDMLDHWLFSEIHRKKKNTYLLQARIFHDLSTENDEYVNEKRYLSIIQSERVFYKNEGTLIYLAYKIKLILRLFKNVLLKRTHIVRITFRELIKVI